MTALTGVIVHPKKQPIAQVRADYLMICEGNQCAAAILNLFEFWTDVKIDSNDQKQIENEIARSKGRKHLHDLTLWIYKSQPEMRKELLNLWSEDMIKKALDLLINEKKFLKKRNNPKNKWDRTLQYLFIITAVQKAINKAFPASPKNRRSMTEKSEIDPRKNWHRNPINRGAIPIKQNNQNVHLKQAIKHHHPQPPPRNQRSPTPKRQMVMVVKFNPFLTLRFYFLKTA